MHLREACVDLDGQVAAIGRIEYPPDPAGCFPLPAHRRVRIRMFSTQLRLAAADAERDEETGFLISKDVGPVVFVPESFAMMIRTALRLRQEAPLEAHLADQQQTLQSCPDREIAKCQPLSDWRLQISTLDGTVRIRLSAALQATRQIPEWEQKSTGNFWNITDDKVAPRITVVFDVDAVTRVVSYGCRGHELFQGADATPMELSRKSLPDLKLADAPIGLDGKLYGYAPQRGPVSFYSEIGSPRIAISDVRLDRYPNGFVTESGPYSWPRIWLDLFDMDGVVRGVRSTFKLTIETNDGYFGDLQQHYQFYEGYELRPEQSIRRARLNFELNLSGLSFSYALFIDDLHLSSRGKHSPGWLNGELILPWELLIIRYPALSHDRVLILDRFKPAGNVLWFPPTF
jgi:hypothetical protein